MSVRSGRVPAEGTERENQEYGSMLFVDREEQGEPVEGNLSQSWVSVVCNFPRKFGNGECDWILLIFINLI